MKNHREKKIEKEKIEKIENEIATIMFSTPSISLNISPFFGHERRYMNLSRQNQVKVLELSRNLEDMMKKDIKFDENVQFIKQLLKYENGISMYDKFEANHPRFEILSLEKIDEIHKRCNLTPEEKYNEWVRLNICAPSVDGVDIVKRCDKYGNCRDCLVAYAMEQEEWTSFELACRNLHSENNGISKTIGDKKPNFLK